MEKDIYGQGLLAYQSGDKEAFFTVESNIAETETWPVRIFYRTFEEMAELEKIALTQARGSILDVGAGAGSHALYLQGKGQQVHALDVSPGAVEGMRKRGVTHVIEKDFFSFQGKRYDTLLLLMNGIGIAGKVEHLPRFFQKAEELLTHDGRIILDSSDLLFLYAQEDGSAMIDLNGSYYGELEYAYVFNGERGEVFPWLFIDFSTLSFYAGQSGFSCEKLYEDDHFQYLAELKKVK